MKHSALILCAVALFAGGASGAYVAVRAVEAARSASPLLASGPRPATEAQASELPEDAAAEPPAEQLEWWELLEPGAELAPSARSKALAGKRVRLVGFMAQMELPSAGAFYLVPRPIACDEAGGGTADLMPASVLVISESASGRAIAFMPGPLDVSGVFEVGNRAGPDGRVSTFRLRLASGQRALPTAPAANGSG